MLMQYGIKASGIVVRSTNLYVHIGVSLVLVTLQYCTLNTVSVVLSLRTGRHVGTV